MPINPAAPGHMRRMEAERLDDLTSAHISLKYIRNAKRTEDDLRVILRRLMVASHSGRIG